MYESEGDAEIVDRFGRPRSQNTYEMCVGHSSWVPLLGDPILSTKVAEYLPEHAQAPGQRCITAVPGLHGVEVRGIEPLASSMRPRRSTN